MVWWTTAVLLTLALGGCGDGGRSTGRPARAAISGVGTGGPDTGLTPASTTATGGSPHDSAVGGGRAHVRVSALAGMRRTLLASARGLGRQVGVEVVDLSTGQTLLSENASVPRAPASLEKLYTAAAMLTRLGPNARLETDLSGIGSLRKGIWHGNLYLRGDGDPTLGDGGWNEAFDHGDGPTAGQLISGLRHAGLRGVDGLLYADASRFDLDPGGPATQNAPDVSDYGGQLSALVYDHGMTSGSLGPAQSAVHELALSARASGFRLVASRKLAVTPPGATILTRVFSPPMSVMLRLMLVPSDDLFADLFAKQLGYLSDGEGTLALGAQAIAATIAQRYHLHPTIHDGSGLDKADRSSPADFISLLRQLYGTPDGAVVRADLPVVGRSGTVEGLGQRTPAAGRCAAKTGTLDNVTNLAGYCQAASGQTLAFTFMADGPGNGQSLGAFTPMLGALAAY